MAAYASQSSHVEIAMQQVIANDADGVVGSHGSLRCKSRSDAKTPLYARRLLRESVGLLVENKY